MGKHAPEQHLKLFVKTAVIKDLLKKNVSVICAHIFVLLFVVSVSAQNNEANLTREIEIQRERLTARDKETRRDAVSRLRIMQNAAASRVAATALSDKDEIVRATVVEALAFLPETEAAALLYPLLLGDKSDFVRRESAFALGEARSKAAAPYLIQSLQADKQTSVKAAAAIALGKIQDERAVAPLAAILRQPLTKKNTKLFDEFLKRSAARALGEIRLPSAVPVLIETLRDQTNAADVRREAAFALGLIADNSAIAVLTEQLKSEDYLLVEIAAAALEKIKLSTVKTDNF